MRQPRRRDGRWSGVALHQHVERHGTREQEALDLIAVEVSHGIELLLALDALGDGAEAERGGAWEAEAGDADFGFTEADEAALEGRWSWVLDVVRPAIAQGPEGAIDDDLAAVSPWGFDPSDIRVPVLIVHGGADRVVPVGHGRWLAGRIPGAELWERPADGHITVLDAAAEALAWLAAR